MRGRFRDQAGLFSYLSTEERIPANHPLRPIRVLVREILASMSRRFSALYAAEGRPSVPPEQLLSALLLQAFYSIRSEQQLVEQLDYNLLFRWFVGLSPDAPIWHATTFTKNRDRLLNEVIFEAFMTRLLNHPKVKPLLSSEHFSVDGTLIQAWASHKSFQPKDKPDAGEDGAGNGDGQDFRGQTRRNDTHASTTDPDSKLYRKSAGQEAKLAYLGHAVMENRNGLAVAGQVSEANGTAERQCSGNLLTKLARKLRRRITVGADKAYDTADHVAALRAANVTPHVAQNNAPTKTGRQRRSAIDARTTRHAGYAKSLTRRKMIECIFGWGKQHGSLRRPKQRGLGRIGAVFQINLIAYNLIRIPKLANI